MKDFQIKDVADIINGFAFESELFNNRKIGLPVVRIRDVIRGFSKTYYSGRYEETYEIENGDLLIGMDGEFNIAQWRGGKALLNQRVCKIVSKPEFAEQDYLKFRLQLILKEIEDKTPFATVKHLSSEELKKSVIKLPKPDEQKRIAAILDKADRLRRQRRFAQTLSDSFLQSAFIKMFGDPVSNPMTWEKLTFGKVCKTRLGKMLDQKRETGKHNKPYLRNTNVKWGGFDLSEVFEMDFDESERKEFRLQKGDVLICEGGEIGRAAIWNNELPECYFQKALHRARPVKDKATSEYIAILLKLFTKNGGFRDVTAQATIAHLTGEKLTTVLIPLPPLLLQEKFAEIVQEFERIRRQQREATRQAEHLFQTLLHRAFRGEL